MTLAPYNSPFLNTNIYLSEDDDARDTYMTNLFRDMATRINSKEIGTYENTELVTGQSWFDPNNFQNKRAAFRTVVTFASLTAIGTTSVPHNLGNISLFRFTKILGTARNAAGTLHVVLPQGGPDDVMITVDANNVNIICATATYNTFSAQVILEYIKN